MKQLLLFCSLPFLIIACDYDQDFAFVPETKAAFFLMENNGQHQLRKVNPDGSVFLSWGESLGLANPSDIAGNGDELWVSLGAEQKLIVLDLETDTQKHSYDLGDFQAHFLCLGNNYLLLSDTVNRELGFFNLKKKELTRIEITQKPGKAVYRSTKFFLHLGKQSVAIYHENAFASLNTLEFSRPIIDLVLDNRFSTWVFTRDSIIYQTNINWNSNSIDGDEVQVAVSKVRHSPYLRASFGKEYTRQLNLLEGRLSNFPNPPADDFEVDFFESRIYFTYQDSLKIKEIQQEMSSNWGPFTGTFRNTYFYIDETGQPN